MPLANDDPVFARRALAHALADYLDRDDVRQAVVLWSGEFEGRGSLFVGLNRYCREVAQAFGLHGKEAELHLRIFRALQSDGAALPVDPLAPAVVPGVPAPPTPVSPPAHDDGSARALEAFWRAVEASAARDAGAAGLRTALLVHARSLPPAWRAPVLAWWSGAAPALTGHWPAGAAGTRVVNVIYVALAECLGPTRADQVFTEAVAQLERADDAALRAIRRYL